MPVSGISIMLKKRGAVVVVGNRGPTQLDARKTMTNNLDIRGLSLVNATPEEKTQAQAALRTGLSNGNLKPIVRKEISLERAGEAHRLVMESGAYGKIVLVTHAQDSERTVEKS